MRGLFFAKTGFPSGNDMKGHNSFEGFIGFGEVGDHRGRWSPLRHFHDHQVSTGPSGMRIAVMKYEAKNQVAPLKTVKKFIG
jgi:hypothetical protein